MSALVTGAAGFTGFHICRTLLERGDSIVATDSLNSRIDAQLRLDRLAPIRSEPGLGFVRLEIEQRSALATLLDRFPHIDRIIHLATVAGVRDARLNLVSTPRPVSRHI